MSLYVKLDCDVLTDAKIIAVGPDGFTMWAKGLAYSKQHLTDGFIPEACLSLIGLGVPDPLAVAGKLVSVGLWQECENGYCIGAEKWAKWQTTKEEVEAKREAARLRKAESRARHAHVTRESQTSHSDVTPPEYRAQSTEHRAHKKKNTNEATAEKPPESAKTKFSHSDGWELITRTILIENAPSLYEAWNFYGSHRAAMRVQPYTEVGLKSLLTKIDKVAKENQVDGGRLLESAIQTTLERNWRGIVPDQLQAVAQSLPKVQQPEDKDWWKSVKVR